VIQAFRKPETSLLIVECKPQEKSVDNLYCALSNLLLNAENKRLLLIAPANDPFVEKFNGHFSAHEQEKIQVVDVTRFNDLTPASQRALLKTSINFQGQPALLSQLLGINDLNQMTSKALDAFDAVIDPSTLAQMIKKEPIALGGEPLRFSQLEAAYAKLYKPIEPQNLVDNLVKIQDSNVLFMISSSDSASLDAQQLIDRLLKIAGTKSRPLINIGSLEKDFFKKKIIPVAGDDAERNFKSLCYKKPRKTIHWVSLNDREIIWQQLYDPNFYVDRKFKKVAVKETVKARLVQSEPTDLLVFSGLSEESLYKLLDVTNKEEKKQIANNLFIFSEHQEQEAESKFNELIKNKPTKPVHWLKIEGEDNDQQLIIKVSFDLSTIQKSSTQESDFSLVNDDKLVVIVDEPGMGKSTLLTRLTEEKLRSSWVIRLNLKDCQKALERLVEKQLSLEKEQEVVEFLWEAVGGHTANTLATNLLRYRLESTTAKSTRPLLVLLDGFDEVQGIDFNHKKQKQEKVIQLLKFLNEKSSAKVWVTTRRHPQLEKELSILFTTEFEAFKQPQKVAFLWRFWQVRYQLLSNQEDKKNIFGTTIEDKTSKFSRYAEALLDRVDTILREKMAPFMGIPLQMRLLAEGFQKNFEDFLKLEDALSENPLPKSYFSYLDNVVVIYQYFIKEKYEIFFKEKTRLSEELSEVTKIWMKEALTKRHRRLGFHEIFSEETTALALLEVKSPYNDENQLNNDQMQELYRIGLVQPAKGESLFEFIHRTFAEYFTADLLSSWLTRKSERSKNSQLIEFLLTKILIQADYQVIRAFLNDHLVKKLLPDNTLTEYGKRIDKLWSAHSLRNEQDETFLIIACREGNFVIIDFLINSLKKQKETLKSLVGYRTKHGDTALHWAANLDKAEVIQALVDAIKNDPKALKGLLETDNKNGQTAVYWATVWGKTKVVQALLDAVKNDPEALKKMGDNIEAAKKDKWTQLCWAAQNGHSETIKLLIDKGAEINAVNKNNETPLHLAAQNGHSETVKLLIDKGAEINAINKNNETPLHLAAQRGHSETVKLLIDKGAEINAINKNNETPLHPAAQKGHSETVKLLTDQGAEINAINKNNETPLHLITVNYLNPEVKILVVNILLDAVKNAQVIRKDMLMARDKSGNIALHNAASWAESEIVQALLDVVKNDQEALKDMVMASDNNGKTVLHWAADGGSEDNLTLKIVQILLDLDVVKNDPKTLRDMVLAKDKGGYTALNRMAKRDRVEAVQVLLDVVKNDPKTLKDMVVAKNKHGSTALNWMAKLGKDKVVQALLDVVEDDSEALKGMVLAKDKDGYIALHWPFRHGNPKVVQSLLDAVKNVPEILKDMVIARDNDGKTALNWAVDGGDPEMFQTLLDAFKNVPEILKDMVMARDNDDKIVLHHAMEKSDFQTNEIVQALLDAIKNTPEILKNMVMARNNNGGTPLHYAMQRSNTKMVQILLDIVENEPKTLKDMVMAKDNNGKTVLHWAIAGWEGNYNQNVIQELLDGINEHRREILKELLEDKDGEMKTALILAAQQGFSNTVKVLITKGAQIEAVGGRDSWTPLHLATQQGHLETAQFLLEKGADVFARNTHDTVLHQAVSGNNIELIRLILKNIKNKSDNKEKISQSINAQDNEGDTPLMWAIKKKIPLTTQVLLEDGVDISVKNKKEMTALNYAAQGELWRIVVTLLNKGAKIKDLSDEQCDSLKHHVINNDDENKQHILQLIVQRSLTSSIERDRNE
jgi:ankyrin repeat protein